jgi:hypothetical protein
MSPRTVTNGLWGNCPMFLKRWVLLPGGLLNGSELIAQPLSLALEPRVCRCRRGASRCSQMVRSYSTWFLTIR